MHLKIGRRTFFSKLVFILACQSLPLTSSVAGAGPRKSPGNGSLLHAIINLVNKEMEQISKTHDLSALEISLNILQNCCNSLECRVLISKVKEL